MARIIGTITLPLVNTTTERFAHAIGEYAKLFIERGFEVEYDNRDNAEYDSVSSQANPFEGRIQNYKIYTKADRTAESIQMRLISPCRRWYLIIHTNGRAEQTFQQISFLVMVPNGTGDITSIHPGMLHGFSTVKPIYPNNNTYSFTYEILENKSSWLLYVKEPVTTNVEIVASYNIPQPIAQGLPTNISMFRITRNTQILYHSAMFALSDNLIPYSDMENAISPISQNTHSQHTDIVNVETALIPMIWSNTGAYVFENLYWGRSTYDYTLVQGVIEVQGKTYRVLYSEPERFICYEI